MKIIYGTGNIGKVEQVKDYLQAANLNVEVITIKDIGFNENIEENGTTFEENSLIKAKAIKAFCDRKKIKGIVVTDDSGLCVECLDGRPGVYSARYAGENATQKETLDKLLNEISKTNSYNRKAQFICVLTAILENGKVIEARGEDTGKIIDNYYKLGKLTYDPVFIPDGFDVPMIDIEGKDLGKTHREKAFLKLFELLKQESVLF